MGRRMMAWLQGGLLALAVVACSGSPRQSDVAGSVCFESRAHLHEPGAVIVRTENNPVLPAFVASRVFAPAEITAKVGQVVEFTNVDPDEQHTAELDDGACGTDFLTYGASDDLVFEVAGSYPFYCAVHGTTMSGTITIVP
jgi:plastocyanin